MKTLWMTRGLPASGKSTWARAKQAELPLGEVKRVNKDDLRAMLDGGKWSPENEAFVVRLRDHIVVSALADGKHVVVDDTNLAPKHETRLRQLARANDAAFELVDFTSVTVEECIARDRKRANYVGEKVIRGMWEEFLRPENPAASADPTLPWCVIVDIDGTLARMNGRSPFEWGRVGEDSPRREIADAVRGVLSQLGDGSAILFVSGRDEICRAETQAWLDREIALGPWPLYMRPEGDQRKDTIVKRELYEAHIRGKFNVRAIFDDRPQVIRLWQELGFGDRIFNVGDGRDF